MVVFSNGARGLNWNDASMAWKRLRVQIPASPLMNCTNMLSSEFLERVSEGRKEFDSIELQYADFDGKTLKGITIRNSRMLFTSMRHCTFEDVTFENCEFFSFKDNGDNHDLERCDFGGHDKTFIISMHTD